MSSVTSEFLLRAFGNILSSVSVPLFLHCQPRTNTHHTNVIQENRIIFWGIYLFAIKLYRDWLFRCLTFWGHFDHLPVLRNRRPCGVFHLFAVLVVRARELTFWENVHLPPPVTCQVSHVTCHVHMSPVTCHMSNFIYIYFFYKVLKLVSGGYVINRAYPV